MNDARPTRRIPSLAGLGGAMGCLAIDVLYVRAIAQQGAIMPGSRVPFVAAWLAGAALLAGIGAITRVPGPRALRLGAAAAAMLALSIPALWSIGGPLFICALATGFGAARAGADLRLQAWKRLMIPVLLVATASVLLLVGFALSDT